MSGYTKQQADVKHSMLNKVVTKYNSHMALPHLYIFMQAISYITEFLPGYPA